MRGQIVEYLLLDRFSFRRRLDHRVARPELRQIYGRPNASEGKRPVLIRYLSSRDLPVHGRAGFGNRGTMPFRIDIHQRHVISGKREHISNAAAHLPRSDHPAV